MVIQNMANFCDFIFWKHFNTFDFTNNLDNWFSSYQNLIYIIL